MNKTLYTCIIEELNAEEAFIQVYWAYAYHLGEAIWMMLNAARVNGLTHPIPRECDPFELKNLNMEVVPNAKANVFWSETRDFFDPEPVFELPVGIIGSCIEGEHDVDEITKGYTRYTEKEGLIFIDVNVSAEDIFPVYSKLLQLQDSYRVFWYVLHSHWDQTKEDKFLTNEQLNTPGKILDHLDVNRLNSINNGFITLTAYLSEGATNLKVTDHKRIAISTLSRDIADQYTRVLEEAGYPQAKKLISIDYKMHHWHYRVPGSQTKADLERILNESGFSDWQD